MSWWQILVAPLYGVGMLLMPIIAILASPILIPWTIITGGLPLQLIVESFLQKFQ